MPSTMIGSEMLGFGALDAPRTRALSFLLFAIFFVGCWVFHLQPHRKKRATTAAYRVAAYLRRRTSTTQLAKAAKASLMLSRESALSCLSQSDFRQPKANSGSA